MKYLILIFGLIILSSSVSDAQIPNNIPNRKSGRSLDDIFSKSKENITNNSSKAQTKSKLIPKKRSATATKKVSAKKVVAEPKKDRDIKTTPKKKLVVQKPELFPTEKEDYKLNYTDKGVSEIGGIIWGDFKALRSDDLTQTLWGNLFYHHFVANYFLLGLRGELDYNFSDSQYTATGYLVAGGVFPATDRLYVLFNLNVGYSYNNYQSSKSLFSYGNEVGLKIKLRENFLLGISIVYSFYTDFTQEFFNDKVRGVLAFSGYF